MNELVLQSASLTQQDISAVSELARTVWQATYPALISQAQIDAMLEQRYSPEALLSHLADPQHALRVVRQGGTLTGFAHAFMDHAGCKLDKLYVHPLHQRRGVGRLLIQELEDWARMHQAPRVWLQVNRGNVAALAAYETYGFRVVAARKFEIGNGFVMDDFVMEKTL